MTGRSKYLQMIDVGERHNIPAGGIFARGRDSAHLVLKHGINEEHRPSALYALVSENFYPGRR